VPLCHGEIKRFTYWYIVRYVRVGSEMRREIARLVKNLKRWRDEERGEMER
jgi:hypothetical protein